MGKDWLETGFDAPEDERSSGAFDTFRFYLKAGAKKSIILLTAPNEFVKIRQHEIWIPGSKSPKYATCCQTDKVDCPLCKLANETNNKKIARIEYRIGTIMDMDGYEKDGKKKGVGQKQILAIKMATKRILEQTFQVCEENDQLIKMGKFVFSRSTSQTAARIGDSFQSIGGFNAKKWAAEQEKLGFEIDFTPFDIGEMDEFQPSYDLCASLAKSLSGVSNSSEFSAEVEEDVAF
jgi:hypothetical protein